METEKYTIVEFDLKNPSHNRDIKETGQFGVFHAWGETGNVLSWHQTQEQAEEVKFRLDRVNRIAKRLVEMLAHEVKYEGHGFPYTHEELTNILDIVEDTIRDEVNLS